MNNKNSVHSTVLEYDYLFEAQTYEETGNEKYLKDYRILSEGNIENLFAYLRRQNNGSWNAQIIAVSTCQQDEPIEQRFECDHTSNCDDFRTDNREGLHIHILVIGENSLEIVNCIADYWSECEGYGDPEEVIEHEYDPAGHKWPQVFKRLWEIYFDSRQLVKRYLLLGNLYGSLDQDLTDILSQSELLQ